MAERVTFDGDNLRILVNSPETQLDVQNHLYSDWKEWVKIGDNAKYPVAMSAIGGQQITDIAFVGITYFLENGWRIEPWAGSYLLSINGNLYTREAGGNPVIPTGGVAVSFNRSNLVDLIAPSSTITNSDLINIANNVWEEVVNSKGTKAREQLGEKIATKTQDIALS